MGNPPSKYVVDHISNNHLDNRVKNLRVCTQSQNLMNTVKKSSNTSGFKGVTYDKIRGTWIAKCHRDGKTKFLGRFNSPEEAHKAYCDEASKTSGEYFCSGVR